MEFTVKPMSNKSKIENLELGPSGSGKTILIMSEVVLLPCTHILGLISSKKKRCFEHVFQVCVLWRKKNLKTKLSNSEVSIFLKTWLVKWNSRGFNYNYAIKVPQLESLTKGLFYFWKFYPKWLFSLSILFWGYSLSSITCLNIS